MLAHMLLYNFVFIVENFGLVAKKDNRYAHLILSSLCSITTNSQRMPSVMKDQDGYISKVAWFFLETIIDR